ncbi:MAG: helix-turn-helix domain-containing protein [Flavisolibacter sp.]|jgi:chromosomal replication initiation ATPase DnaA
MLSEVQEVQVQQILDDASNRISEVFGKEIRVFCNASMSNNIKRLKEVICFYYNITWEQVLVKNRKQEVVMIRQLFSWFAVKHFNYSRVFIGKELGRDHTSIVHALQTVEDMIWTKHEEYMTDIAQIKALLSTN